MEHCFSIKFSRTAEAIAAPSKVVVPRPGEHKAIKVMLQCGATLLIDV